ncbi:hypothetical protein GKE82_26255 [Conexibacter sp. W3-3-2]|uniref:hypothetical protein n=1 Tax=Conexibacter sp. W3-3-2 TaxID=2675227 RepID=UPI0012B6C694|nr:hypothetical protein [Conexibacter sp. W3-3-2]MTD47625.1 hypothetical protein [Conexibacter sp. W3-3-2]MTD47709.1 hypothetical protein [Conexibacter sp. W3-3-2]
MTDLRLVPDPLPAVPGLWPNDTLEVDVSALVDAELRLLARATGDHLPAELQAQVLELRAQRARAGV